MHCALKGNIKGKCVQSLLSPAAHVKKIKIYINEKNKMRVVDLEKVNYSDLRSSLLLLESTLAVSSITHPNPNCLQFSCIVGNVDARFWHRRLMHIDFDSLKML